MEKQKKKNKKPEARLPDIAAIKMRVEQDATTAQTIKRFKLLVKLRRRRRIRRRSRRVFDYTLGKVVWKIKS